MEIDIGLILAYTINLVVLFVILKLLVYKPVNKYLLEREQRYSQQREDMDIREAEIETQEKKYVSIIGGARDEASKIERESRIDANRRAQVIIDDSKRHAKELLESARKEIAEERDIARMGMREEVAVLSVEIASKVLEREVSLEDNKAVVDKFLSRERLG